MAILHQATIVPSKQEILGGWLPDQPWYPGGDLRLVGGLRLDDPAGEVGVELLVLHTDDGTVVHVPCTYRGAEAPELAHALMGTATHSVLGTRWLYDADADPVYRTAVRQAILTGPAQAAETVHHLDGTVTERTPLVQARAMPGTGSDGATTVRTVRLPHAPEPGVPTLAATWEGQDEPLTLAVLV
ncbi:hypothetical protein GCM10009718_04610 [Isoptericola halotolerans]|uniref:Maltokinase N-terminal cap domain-containing protein n=1 Tax=Isoptericola halotolerans TaxID=300560 RepID=A0ABX2A1I7_9MICO|nr:hypothetical protein [Isoptericola halotolerans]NOV96615.1 hypothetical protein [Isoptericola halotolerans]